MKTIKKLLVGVLRGAFLFAIQERSLSIDLRFGGAEFSRMFQGPVASLERVFNLMYDTARYERVTAEMNRDTVERLIRGADSGTSMFDLSRGKKRRE